MPDTDTLPIFDNHLHLRRDGKGVQAVKEFERAGGTHLVLCQLPMVERVIEGQSYLPCYMDTLALADEAMQATDVTVYVTVGPYPVDYLRLRERCGRDMAMDVMRRGMEQAQRLCIDGDAVAIGEIGRPHFDVDEQAWRDSNMLLRYGMEQAAAADVPVVLHTESLDPDGFAGLAGMADKAGLARDMVVKHFSPPLVRQHENHGLLPSVLAGETALRTALEKGCRFVMETDFIDDPSRPGAVLGPKTVPRRTLQLREEGVMSDEAALMVHKKIPERIYGICVD